MCRHAQSQDDVIPTFETIVIIITIKIIGLLGTRLNVKRKSVVQQFRRSEIHAVGCAPSLSTLPLEMPAKIETRSGYDFVGIPLTTPTLRFVK